MIGDSLVFSLVFSLLALFFEVCILKSCNLMLLNTQLGCASLNIKWAKKARKGNGSERPIKTIKNWKILMRMVELKKKRINRFNPKRGRKNPFDIQPKLTNWKKNIQFLRIKMYDLREPSLVISNNFKISHLIKQNENPFQK